MPFVAEKITEIMYSVINKDNTMNEEETENIDVSELIKGKSKLMNLKKN